MSRPSARPRSAVVPIVVLTAVLAIPSGNALAGTCGCGSPGVPVFSSIKMRGNDLREVKGGCATPGGVVELSAYQQHIKRQKVCPPDCPTKSIWSYCINQCAWTPIATTRADSAGRFTFRDIDAAYSLQLIAALPGQPGGLDGVYSALKLRGNDPRTGSWSTDFAEPSLEAFHLSWPGYEGGNAYVETRVSRAGQVHVSVADGPDDGDDPSIALDVDEDTPNYWLGSHLGKTVQYTKWGVCDPSQGCSSDWHILQSPSVNVASPPLGRGSEFPWVLGMVTASRPGAMFIATSILGPRDIPDVSVQVNVDLDLDLNLGFSFFSLF